MWIDPNEQRSLLHRQRQGRVGDVRRRPQLHHVRQHGHRPVLRGHGRQSRSVLPLRRPAGQRQLGRTVATAATTTASSATTGSSSTPATVSTPPSIPTTGASSTPRRRTAACAGSTRRSGRPATACQPAASRRSSTIADVSQREGKAPQFRYNWSSPLILSPHDSKTLYIGGNRLMSSTDRGETLDDHQPRSVDEGS